MSPEQAKGKAADKRSDIWAFGCVLYEMLTGRRAFAGDDVSDTLAAVLRGEPTWDALPKDVPETIRALLKGCLEKDRQKRVSDIAVARFVMADTGGFRAPATTTVQAGRPSRARTVVAVAAIVVAAAAATAGAMWLLLRPTQPAPRPMRFAIVPPPSQPLAIQGTDRDIAIAPDGAFFVYRTVAGGAPQLAVRAFDGLDAKLLAGTASSNPGIGTARSPFVSPDGQWVGFQDFGALRKIAVSGGSAFTLCPITGSLRGATWGEDNTIVFATQDFQTGLLSVAAGGGEPKVLTKAEASRGELDHLFPSLLPGGRAVLFAIVTAPGPDGAQVAVLDLETGEQRVLIRGGNHPQYLNTGHLLYAVAGGLRAVLFDPSTLEVLGDPVPVLDQVFIAPTGVANAAVSREGTLVYVPGTGPVGPLREPWCGSTDKGLWTR
jgi:serine/threonine-protein kinase